VQILLRFWAWLLYYIRNLSLLGNENTSRLFCEIHSKLQGKFAAVSGFLCVECSVTAAVQSYRDTIRWTSCSTCIYLLFIYLFIYYNKEYWYTNIQHSGKKDHKINNKMKWLSWNMYIDYIFLVTVISKSVRLGAYLDTLGIFQCQQDNFTHLRFGWMEWYIFPESSLCLNGEKFVNLLLVYVWTTPYSCIMAVWFIYLNRDVSYVWDTQGCFPKPGTCTCSYLDIVVLFYYLYSFLLL